MLTLEKGKPALLLSKNGDGLKEVKVELYWDPNTNPKISNPFDLDVSMLFLENDRFVFDEPNIVFYNNICNVVGGTAEEILEGKTDAEIQLIVEDYIRRGSYCITLGDNKKGDKIGPDEVILWNLLKTPQRYNRVLCAVTIHEAIKRNQFLGDVKNAHITLVDQSGTKILDYKLDEKFTNETGVVIAEFYRDADGLQFVGKADGFSGGLATLFKLHS